MVQERKNIYQSIRENKSKWKKIQKELFEAPFPHFTIFEFKRGGKQNLDFEYKSLGSTDYTFDMKEDALLATLIADGRNFFKFLYNICEVFHYGKRSKLYVYVNNQDYIWRIFLTELKTVRGGLFFKLEGKEPPKWARNIPRNFQTALSDEDLKIKVEEELSASEKNHLTTSKRSSVPMFQNILESIWSSITEILKNQKVGKPAFISFLLQKENERKLSFARIHKRRPRKPFVLHLYHLDKKLAEIEAVNRVVKETFPFVP